MNAALRQGRSDLSAPSVSSVKIDSNLGEWLKDALNGADETAQTSEPESKITTTVDKESTWGKSPAARSKKTG